MDLFLKIGKFSLKKKTGDRGDDSNNIDGVSDTKKTIGSTENISSNNRKCNDRKTTNEVSPRKSTSSKSSLSSSPISTNSNSNNNNKVNTNNLAKMKNNKTITKTNINNSANDANILKIQELEEHVERLQDQIGRLSTLLEEAMEEKTFEMDEKFKFKRQANELQDKVDEVEQLLSIEKDARQKVKDECAKLHDEIFVLRSKTTSAAAEKRQGRTISLPGTPAEKHGYVMNNKSLTYNQSNIKKNNKNNNNNNVSSALSNGAMFAKRLWRGATSDTTSKTKKKPNVARRTISAGDLIKRSPSPISTRKLSASSLSLPGSTLAYNDEQTSNNNNKKNNNNNTNDNDTIDDNGDSKSKQQSTVEDFSNVISLLSSIAIFRHMNLHEKEVIVRTMVRENFNAGEFVVRQGELGTSFYIILSGSLDVITHDVKPGKTIKAAKLSNRSARLVAKLTAGQWFGETGLVRSLPRTASVCAATNSSCLKLERNIFDDLCHNFDATVLENMKVYSNYRESNDFVEELRDWLGSASNKKQYITVLKKYPMLTLDLNSSRKRRKSVAGGPEQLDRDLKREAGVVLNNELFSFHGTNEPTEMVFGRFHALLNTLVLKMLHKNNCFSEQNVKAVITDIMLASNRTIAGGDSYGQTNLLLGNSDLVVLSPESAEAEPSKIDISIDTCTVSIVVTQKYKVSHFDDDMTVELWAFIQTQLNEQIMYDVEKIIEKTNEQQKKLRKRDSSNKKDIDDKNVANILESRVSVRVLDIKTIMD